MKKNKRIKYIIAGILALLAIGSAAMVIITGYLTFSNITHLSTNETTAFENNFEFYDKYGFDYSGFQKQYNMETVSITSSYDGHAIPADHIYTKNKDADTIILIHGLGGNRRGMLLFAERFLDKGYNILTYDQRSAGENLAENTTFGYLESYDAADYVEYLDKQIGADKNIYLLGVSNGAATAGISVRHEIVKKRVASIIMDCPFNSTVDMMRVKMSSMDLGIPLGFMIFCGDLYNRMALGFSYAQASAVPYLAESRIPVLIIASKGDDFTPYRMAEKIHEAAPESTLVSVDDSKHADIFFDHTEWYVKTVCNFINP